MSSLKRMLAVFDAFSSEHAVLTAEEIMSTLGYSRGTAYRYVKELCDAGFLTRAAGGYALGPRIIQLDYCIRQRDPILMTSLPVMQALRKRYECDVLLTVFYEDQVVVTHRESGDQELVMSYGRGREMPLFRGAGSKVLLACLPPARQKRLYGAHAEAIAQAGLGESWEAFRASLAAVKRMGHAVSFSELDQGNVGVAAPIEQDPLNMPAGLVMVFRTERYEVLDKDGLLQSLKTGIRQIADHRTGAD